MQTSERSEILSLVAASGGENFEALAQKVFQYQRRHNPLYAEYLRLLGREDFAKHTFPPCLPIGFFKSHRVQTGTWEPALTFTSSATTGQRPSEHVVRDPALYLENARCGFATHWGDPSEWCVLALLPAYLERSGSSLVAMADDFIALSRYPESGFYLHNFDDLQAQLRHCLRHPRPTLLLGVSFALLDFAETHAMDLRGIHIMETGGMKGRREEITRADLHQQLRAAFQVEQVFSEYGMTELFSQAYMTPTSGGRFLPAPTMRVFATEVSDPFALVPPGRTGVLNIIDLANVDSCAFVATEDLGRVWPDGSFEVLGRLDAAELRGCNLMVDGGGVAV